MPRKPQIDPNGRYPSPKERADVAEVLQSAFTAPYGPQPLSRLAEIVRRAKLPSQEPILESLLKRSAETGSPKVHFYLHAREAWEGKSLDDALVAWQSIDQNSSYKDLPVLDRLLADPATRSADEKRKRALTEGATSIYAACVKDQLSRGF